MSSGGTFEIGVTIFPQGEKEVKVASRGSGGWRRSKP
ncbi:hypothetical protein K378_00767 [Streptomyces sp. Amel2xB2]|nr:hypothetical protein K378_00767 [Streptomyces sp. Amel2xB2]